MRINISELDGQELVAVMQNPSYITIDEDEVLYMESEAKQVCFVTYNRRAIAVERESIYQCAVKREGGHG